jgi:hypothetical protein
MIELISENNTALVLDPKTKIRVEWNSPFFSEEVIQGNFVYWFNIPVNPVNIKELGHANYPGAAGKARVLNYRLILLRSISMTGKLIVSTFKDKFRCAFTTNTLQDFKEVLISDIPYDSDINMGTTTQNVIDHAEGKNSLSYPATKYVFPVIENTKLYGSSNDDFLGYVNNWDFLTNEFFINSIDSSYDPDTDEGDGINNNYSLSPQFFLQYIIDKIFDVMQLDHFGDFITNSNFQQLLLYNAFCLDDNFDEYWAQYRDGDYAGVGGLIRFPNAGITRGSQVTGNQILINVDTIGWYTVSFKVKVTIAVPIDLDVQINTVSVTSDPAGGATVSIPAAEASTTEIVEVFHTFYVDTASTVSGYVEFILSTGWTIVNADVDFVNTSQTNLNRYAKDIVISNHIPPVTISNFLNELRKFWQMAILIDSANAQAEFFLVKDLFDASFEDYTDKIKKGERLESIDKLKVTVDFDWDKEDNFLDTNQYNNRGSFDQYIDLPQSRNIQDIATMNPANNIYKVNYIDFENIWQRLTDIDQYREFGAGDETKPITLGMHPALMTGYIYADEFGKSEFLFAIPRLQQKGKSKLFGSDNDLSAAMKLMNWFELGDFERIDQVNDTYPFATSHDTDSLGVATGKYSMFLKGDNSIGEIYHKPWYDFLKNTETYSFDVGENFGVASLLNLLRLIQPQKGITVANQKRWMMIESIKYLPKIINIEVSMDGLQSVEIKAVKQAFDNNAQQGSGSAVS